MNYTYLLRCADHSLYCGWTNHLEQRVKAHNEGKGAKYTKSRRPVTLAYYEEYATKEEALRREAAIKKMTKQEKERLVMEADAGFRIMISPAKRMRSDDAFAARRELPIYLRETEQLLDILRQYKEPQLQTLFAANPSITHENYLRFQTMDLKRGLTPALLSYMGIQYQYMAPQVFTEAQWRYVCRHLRILSGFYGVLRPDDGIVPYRLEMQAKLATEQGRDLYAFWGEKIYLGLRDGRRNALRSGVPDAKKEAPLCVSPPGLSILNLASKEYSKSVEPWLRPGDVFVTCIFGTLADGAVKVKATEAKMARGEMVRFLAEREAADLNEAKAFDRLGFRFVPERSDERTFTFVK